MNPGTSRNLRNVVFLLVLCLIIFGIGHLLFPNLGVHGKAQAELLHFFRLISVDDTASQVETQFQQAKFRYLMLLKPRTNLWVVQTPFKAGASNWDLW